MKKILLVLLILAPSLVCLGQTNTPVARNRAANAAARGAASPRSVTVFSNPVSGDWNPAHISSYSRVDGEQALAPPGPAYTGSKRAASLQPKIVQTGHVQIYSPVVTAVARKNPLCVLDSTFLSISF